jgi:hypothetical protein
MMRAIGQFRLRHLFCQPLHDAGTDSIRYNVTGTHRLHLFVPREIADKIDMKDWSTLNKYHFVSVPETDFTLARQIKTICMNRGVDPDIINYYNRADTLFLAVNSGIGMAICRRR